MVNFFCLKKKYDPRRRVLLAVGNVYTFTKKTKQEIEHARSNKASFPLSRNFFSRRKREREDCFFGRASLSFSLSLESKTIPEEAARARGVFFFLQIHIFPLHMTWNIREVLQREREKERER